MSFAFNNIILNQLPLTQNAGRLYINGNPIAFSSEAAGSVTGLTIGSGDARYVRTSGNQSITGGLKVLSGILGSTGQVQIDPFNSYLYANGAISVDWSEKSLFTSDQSVSASWDDRILSDSSEDASVDWENKQLSGNWQTNTNPTSSGHIVNKGYLDNVTGSLGVTIPNDVVRTTGNQSISGNKVFAGVSNFNDGVNMNRGLNVTDEDSVTSATFNTRFLYDMAGNASLSWDGLEVRGVWSHTGIASAPNHITNKQYVDSTSSYTIPFGHTSSNLTASSSGYFASAPVAFSSSEPNSPIAIVPKSGILKSIVGVCSIAGTLASAGVVNLVVFKNGVSVATGTYVATGRNNVISSGVQSLNIPVSELDYIKLMVSTPAWVTNPTSVSHSLNAYITLG